MVPRGRRTPVPGLQSEANKPQRQGFTLSNKERFDNGTDHDQAYIGPMEPAKRRNEIAGCRYCSLFELVNLKPKPKPTLAQI